MTLSLTKMVPFTSFITLKLFTIHLITLKLFTIHLGRLILLFAEGRVRGPDRLAGEKEVDCPVVLAVKDGLIRRWNELNPSQEAPTASADLLRGGFEP